MFRSRISASIRTAGVSISLVRMLYLQEAACSSIPPIFRPFRAFALSRFLAKRGPLAIHNIGSIVHMNQLALARRQKRLIEARDRQGIRQAGAGRRLAAEGVVAEGEDLGRVAQEE